jgi:hypothetical protein
MRSAFLASVAVAALAGAALAPALAADRDESNDGTVARYDDQADQTRALNREALELAKEQNEDAVPQPASSREEHYPGDYPASGQRHHRYHDDSRDNRDDENAPASDNRGPMNDQSTN